MELLTPLRNLLVDEMATQLAGGHLAFYDGIPGRHGSNVLVTVPLPLPAFRMAINGEAVSVELEAVEVQSSGDVSWAQLTRSDGLALANLTVRQQGQGADIVMNRLDVQRGGPFTTRVITLRLPSTA